MKQLILKQSIILSLFILSGCSQPHYDSPTQNSALNKISNSNASSKSGALQTLLDDFLETKWLPTLQKDKEIREKYIEKKSRNFTLQEYIDKRAAYLKAHPSDFNNSNVHKLEMMPVIGSGKKRR